MEEGKKRSLTIGNETIEVSEEVYRAYMRPIKAENQRKRRQWKCRVLSENGGHYYRCNNRCEACAYYLAGNNALGNHLSLDKMVEDGVFIEDKSLELENNFIEKETNKEEYKKLYEAIKKLTEKEKSLLKLLFYKHKSTVEVSVILGVSQQAISKAKMKIIKKLKLFLKKWL